MVYDKLLTFIIQLIQNASYFTRIAPSSNKPWREDGRLLRSERAKFVALGLMREKACKHLSRFEVIEKRWQYTKMRAYGNQDEKTSTNWHQIRHESWSLQPSGCPKGHTRSPRPSLERPADQPPLGRVTPRRGTPWDQCPCTLKEALATAAAPPGTKGKIFWGENQPFDGDMMRIM